MLEVPNYDLGSCKNFVVFRKRKRESARFVETVYDDGNDAENVHVCYVQYYLLR